MDPLLAGHALATWFMTGVIVFVQVVHYPLMARVGRDRFREYEADHTRRTTWIVAPPMLIEAATALALVTVARDRVPELQAWFGLTLVLVIWISTAALQVPQHRRLESGFDAVAHRRLVSSNWIRVAAWSARSALVAGWLF